MAVKILTEITGDNTITDKSYLETLTVTGKYERTFYGLLDTDGNQSIPVTNFGTIQKFIIDSTSCNLNITDGSGSYSIPISGLFTWTVSSTYVATITALSISTDSASAINADVTIIGV